MLSLCLFALLPAVVFSRTPDQLVIGGSEAADGAWPWQLSLRAIGGAHSCGAALIGSAKAVTAAHCVGGTAVQYEILAGANQRSCEPDTCTAAQTRRLSGVTRHPEYVDNANIGYPNDIATLTWLNPLLPAAGKIQYVTLTTSTDQVNRNCFITGWGKTSGSDADLPENLQEAKVDVLTTAECQVYWSAPGLITDNQICIFDKQNQAIGSCSGDGGSPLVCQTNLGRWELVGVLSWNRNVCGTDYPSVFSRISSYQQWITQN